MYMKSQLFRKAVRYIEEQDYDDWFILSAKYGLISKEKEIEPYDLTLNNMRAKERKQWAEKVFNDLMKYNPSQIDFYAGKKYREYIIPLLLEKEVEFSIPLEGLGIGQQLHFYKENIRGNTILEG